MTERRVGIFGGSFDPIHIGHLLIAEQFAQDLKLDKVKFIPAKVSPFKVGYEPTSDKHRLEMLKLAVGANPKFEVDPIELNRGGVSYTIDTVRALQHTGSANENGSVNQIGPDVQYYLLVGADSLKDFKKWKSPAELLRSVSLVVARRGGEPEPRWEELDGIVSAEEIAQIQSRKLDLPAVEVSSSDLRRRIEQGRSIRYLLPSAVEVYIKEHGLYQAPVSEKSGL
jgi:nicotinate-nucleotide adenylyltransferase